MKRFSFLALALGFMLSRAVAADSEATLLAVLQSPASGPDKCAACLQLRIAGTAQCVPALAALLGNPAISHAARNALEGLPFPEAGDALRAALGTTSGLTKAGVIDSLGWRGEAASVPLLVPLLNDTQPEIAAASAGALGRLATPDAAAALAANRDRVGPTVQPVILEAMLRAADRLVAQQPEVATELYQSLYQGNYSPVLRAAAGRGLVLAHPELITQPEHAGAFQSALASDDPFLRAAALSVLRQTKEPQVLLNLLETWSSLSPQVQVALLDACMRLPVRAVATARNASQSQVPNVRVAAWQALAELNDLESVPALAQAATAGDPTERDAARDSLTRLRGGKVLAVLAAHMEKATPTAKTELLRVLGERGDPTAGEVLLRSARDPEPMRSAALEALARLASPTLLSGLLELAAQATADQDAEPLLRALLAACQMSPDREANARQVVEAMSRFSKVARRQTLLLLSELGTTPALNLALADSRDSDRDLQKEAVRVLGQWPNAAPATRLLELAQPSSDPVVQVLALRGAVEAIGQEPNAEARLPLLRQALNLSQRPEEKKLVLGRLGQIPTADSLALLTPHLADPVLAEEAAVAAISVAEKLAATQAPLAMDTAAKVLVATKNAGVVKRAWALRGENIKPSPFLNQWQVCGPFTQAGATSALQLFDLALGPEKPGDKVEWRAVRGTDVVPLSSLFPGKDQCVAYLKCQVVATQAQDALLLMGSDDGIKAWLNGRVVHTNNVDRGWVADSDAASVKLVAGTNDLMLKVTQGGGGWSASARLVGTDGRPISGLQTVPVPASVTPAQF